MNNNIKVAGGYLTRWLICGPAYGEMNVDKNSIPTSGIDDSLRSLISDATVKLPENVSYGDVYAGQPWRYWQSKNNIFVDLSKFYFHLCTITYYAFTQIEAEEEKDINLCLWCFPATDVWLNGRQIIFHEAAIYKPMRRTVTNIHLNKGKNDIFVQCQNLGVRDTRNMFGIQLQGDIEHICNILPDSDGRIKELDDASDWLKNICWTGNSLEACKEPVAECSVNFDYGKDEEAFIWSEGNTIPVPDNCEEIDLSLTVCGEELTRNFDLITHKMPLFGEIGNNIEESRKIVLEEQCGYGTICTPIDDTGVYAYSVFARMISNGGKISDIDKEILLHSLEIVDSCSDCSDFALTALLRIMFNFHIEDTELLERMKQVVLNFRYWTDEHGCDAMCFTSENHSLLFHGCQLAAGRLFPEEVFTRSGRTGSQMNRIGNERCKEWLEHIQNRGFEEFLSAHYLIVTAAALLTLVDYGNEKVSVMAEKTLTGMLEQLARQTFRGTVIGPMGRTYRDVIMPYRQELQSLIEYIYPGSPKAKSYFLPAFAKTSYKIPDYIIKLMDAPASAVFRSGSAEINLEKTKDYLLSSVSCPNVKYAGNDDMKLFVPGNFGYQQHMWYAALDKDCVAFINHPGDSKDKGMVRPGYWFGNGLMPALKQQGRMLAGIYNLEPEIYPISFTHLFWPAYTLDESVLEANWFFGRKGNGYMAVWSSVPSEPFVDVLTVPEYRFYGQHQAFFCLMGSTQDDGDFARFMEEAKAMRPVLSDNGIKFSTTNGFILVYKENLVV